VRHASRYLILVLLTGCAFVAITSSAFAAADPRCSRLPDGNFICVNHSNGNMWACKLDANDNWECEWFGGPGEEAGERDEMQKWLTTHAIDHPMPPTQPPPPSGTILPAYSCDTSLYDNCRSAPEWDNSTSGDVFWSAVIAATGAEVLRRIVCAGGACGPGPLYPDEGIEDIAITDAAGELIYAQDASPGWFESCG
jgi:hypothetical protein